MDQLLARLYPEKDERNLRKFRQELIERYKIDEESLEPMSGLIESTVMLAQLMLPIIRDEKAGTIHLPEEVCLHEKAQDLNWNFPSNLHCFYPSDRAKFCSEEASEWSSLIFGSLSSAQPDRRLNWTNLKSLSIARIETSKLLQLLQESSNLEQLLIIVLQFNKNEKVEINLTNMQVFRILTLEGRGELKLVTPKLTRFELKNKPTRTFSKTIQLTFPEKLESLGVEEFEPSMQQFKNLESLACDGGLPDGLLSTFTKLKKLQSPFLNGNNRCLLGMLHEFSPRKERILSILKEKKRLKRTALEIMFCGILIEDEWQLNHSEDLADFLTNNYAKVNEERPGNLYALIYNPQASLPDDCLRHLKMVTITGAVDDLEKLSQFLARLENLIRLITVDATLDANFYNNLVGAVKFSELEIVHTDKPIDLSKMADFNFLLLFDDLVDFHTDLPLSLEIIEKLLNKFTEKFFICCEFNGQKAVSIRRVADWFAFEVKDEAGSFDTLQSLIEQLAKM